MEIRDFLFYLVYDSAPRSQKQLVVRKIDQIGILEFLRITILLRDKQENQA